MIAALETAAGVDAVTTDPADPGAVLIDTGGLDRVVDLSIDDGYVTVEAGCTWAALAESLAPTNCRPAFFGPFSGAFATVGGAVSQSAVVWGAGRHGASAEAVLSLGVVLADGTLLRTGHDATRRPDGSAAPPHFRPYGPDLTRLFLGDCGALGVKATVTLRLVDVPAALAPLTFTFGRDDDLVAAMGELARRELASTVVATDAAMARQRIRRATLEQGRLPEDGDIGHALHVVVDGPTAEGVAAEADLVTVICTGHGGTDADPGPTRELVDLRYLTMTSSVGPDRERWAALAEHESDPETDAFVETYRREMLDLFRRMGTAHLQIGRTYPYATTRDPATLALLRATKHHVDPEGLINPGVLGLP